MFEEKKSDKDAMPPGNCSRRYQNTGVLEEVQDEKVPVEVRTPTHSYNFRRGILFVHFPQKNYAPFKPNFEYLTDRFRNALKNLKPGKGPSNASPSESF